MHTRNISPKLVSYAVVSKNESKTYLCAADAKIEINVWTEKILECFDGSKTIQQIAESICSVYKGSSLDDVLAKVSLCFEKIWDAGIFLEHDIDVEMSINLYRQGDFVYLPTFALLPELELSYLSPCLNPDYYGTPNSTIKSLVPSTITVGKLDQDGHISSIIVFLHMSCSHSFSLTAVYGNNVDVLSHAQAIKQCINDYRAKHGVTVDESKPIGIVRLSRSDEMHCSEGEAIQYRLRGEFPNADLIASYYRSDCREQSDPTTKTGTKNG